MDNGSLGKRMKEYEAVNKSYLTRRMPIIIRVDGKAFHSFTRGMERPFDEILIKSMQETAIYMCANIQGCKLAYTQSDEISLLLTDYDDITTSAWFDKNIQKMVSVSASIGTMAFNNAFRKHVDQIQKRLVLPTLWGDKDEKLLTAYKHKAELSSALFDSRVFVLPKEEVCNYFIWRQQDATRNAIQMVGQANFSDKQLHGVNCDQIQEMLFQEKGINFNDFPIYQKRGSCTVKNYYEKENALQYGNNENGKVRSTVSRSHWVADLEIPIFTQNRHYIERYV